LSTKNIRIFLIDYFIRIILNKGPDYSAQQHYPTGFHSVEAVYFL
jgi:hypothetical protein